MDLNWHVSSYSNGGGGACVEIADLPDAVLVRDTKDRTRPPVQYAAQAWRSFVLAVKRGEFE